MKKIGVIGATGAIGVSLINRYIENDAEVYAFVSPNSKRVENIPLDKKVHIVRCGMEEMSSFNVDALPNLDVFYFLSWKNAFGSKARNDMKTQIENINYSIDAVRFAERLGCKRFIGTGSQAEYGRYEGALDANTPCFPENGYGIAKLCAGNMTRIECRKKNIQHIWTRVLSVYGPYDGENTMVSYAIKTCLKGENPEFTKCEQIWDYLSSYDAGKALYLIGENGVSGKIYVLGSGKTRKLSDYINILCACIDKSIKPVFGTIPYVENQVMHLEADISELYEDTGFKPSLDFETGIRQTIEWYRERYV